MEILRHKHIGKATRKKYSNNRCPCRACNPPAGNKIIIANNTNDTGQYISDERPFMNIFNNNELPPYRY